VEKLKEDGAEPQRTTPDEFQKFIAVEAARWRKVVHDAGIRLE
jgi:tripartite-type tricarboxylate transporter receptor subunit TctC